MVNSIFLVRLLLLLVLFGFIWMMRPKSSLHRVLLFPLTREKRTVVIIVAVVTILTAILPMRVNPVWNQEGWGHHVQYQKMAQSIIDGHLYLDYGDPDPVLVNMENPYDPNARQAMGAQFEWDHAWYNNHYYMYFGIVPVILLFVPLKIIGITITECHATQFFALFFVIGIFALFAEISKKFCKDISLTGYLTLSVAASYMNVWYAVKYPSLYCTAITSGMCMAIWGFYLMFRVFVAGNVKREKWYIFMGALFSALVFGCRPTIGFVTLTYIPMILYYLFLNISWQERFSQRIKQFFAVVFAKEHRSKWVVICIPYLVVAGSLMWYNYARFENPFEFGQTYQLTSADQHTYMEEFDESKIAEWTECISDTLYYFVSYSEPDKVFPYVHSDGVLILFPMILIGIRSINWWNSGRYRTYVKGLCPTILFTILFTCAVQSMWAPWPDHRYAMDFTYLLTIMMMFGACSLFSEDEKDNGRVSCRLALLGLYTCVVSCCLFFTDEGMLGVSELYPELMDSLRSMLTWR